MMSFVHVLEENVDDCDDDFPRPCDDHFFFVLDNNGDFPILQDDHFVPKLSAEKVCGHRIRDLLFFHAES